MKCAYCGEEAKGTREHIISSGILDLFPECDLTFDEYRKVIHNADPVVNDVCAKCNNSKISYIDSYAKDFVAKYCLEEYDEKSKIQIEYNYSMIQKMLLKFAYNDLRSKKLDYSYYDEELISYLTDNDNDIAKKYVTIMCGLAVNTSPMPNFFRGNKKLEWIKDPVFFDNSTIQYIDYQTGQIHLNENVKNERFENLVFSYVFRFNSLQFLLLCWDKKTDNEKSKIVLKYQYPYALLDESGEADLLVCTDEINYHHIEHIHVNWDLIKEVQTMRRLSSPEQFEIKEKLEKEFRKTEKMIAKENPRNK